MMLPALPITTSTGDASSSVTSPSGQEVSPKDFVELLGKRLSAASASSADTPPAEAGTDQEALLNALEKDIGALDEASLNTLLSSFGALSGALARSDKPVAGDAAQADKPEKPDSVDDKAMTDAAAAMQALFAMLPTAPTMTGAGAMGNNGDKLNNAALSKTGEAETKRQGVSVTALADGNDTDDDALSPLVGAAATPGWQNSAKLPAATNQPSADDAAALAAAMPALTNERGNPESAGTAENSVQPSPVPLASNLQSTFTNASATLTPPSGAPLNTPFGSAQWQDALSQQIVMFSRNGQQNAELRLNPQELGSLHISLKIDDNQAQIHLVSANSQVRSALEAALPHLRNAMAESGINLGQSSVGSDASGWQQPQQQLADSNSNSGGSSSYQQQFGAAPHTAPEGIEVSAQLQSMASSLNGVDIFA